ncbi:MAG: hypothetical protein ACREEP_21925 [Dongiaceae bacterium]
MIDVLISTLGFIMFAMLMLGGALFWIWVTLHAIIWTLESRTREQRKPGTGTDD